MSAETIVLITGANQGLGFHTARELLLLPKHHVIVGSRRPSSGDAAVEALRAVPGIQGTVSTVALDVTDPRSIATAKSHIETTFQRLDVLVNNAGIFMVPKDISPSGESSMVNDRALQHIFATNVVGVASVTEALLPLLRRSTLRPRLVFVSSSMASFTYNSDPRSPHGGSFAVEYRASKAAMNMLLLEYHMSQPDMTVIGADPGFCATEVTGEGADAMRAQGAAEPEVGGRVIASIAKGDKDNLPGRVHSAQGVVPW
ncbi:hypothetical protein N7468_000924 [Penicillium chermesinum]|uniref:Uncharacterized protein n=1 Tax=Penicillium chermesinum TaxID=63820 RepID=A0A9W9PFM6_9EURO|nr:uncharacterized protein N7468_000924 [Penicillium chermesinum]KAJ5245941.1 hypothetical protein N7468_000924 [Penicillium chermesinum]